jgi:hypothetical protein
MKKAFVFAALLTAAGLSTQAQTNVIPVKFKGVITFPVNQTAVSHQGVTGDGLVSAPGDALVLVIDQTNHELRLDEVDGNTNLVAQLITSRRLALLPDRSFSAGTHFDFVIPANTPFEVNGDLQVSGKVTPATGAPKTINATVIGVLNDSVNGASAPGELDITLKGKLTPAGKIFDGGPFGL